jgi:hypothetical protein
VTLARTFASQKWNYEIPSLAGTLLERNSSRLNRYRRNCDQGPWGTKESRPPTTFWLVSGFNCQHAASAPAKDYFFFLGFFVSFLRSMLFAIESTSLLISISPSRNFRR